MWDSRYSINQGQKVQHLSRRESGYIQDGQRLPPRAVLPQYELPPSYVPENVRRFNPDYSNDIRKFQNRTVHLRRSKPSDQLGFNVRGGAEHKCGIFISKVMPGTDADRVGLQEGDQILLANEESFLHIEQAEAVKILKKYTDITLVVKYFPYGYDKSFDKCKTMTSPVGPYY